MSLNLETDVAELKATLRKLRDAKLIKKAKGKEGKQVHELLQLLDLQLGMLAATSEKVKVAIEARDMTIHHLGDQLMDLRSRDEKPFFVDASSNAKKTPGLYRPGTQISEAKRESLENDMYMQMARLSLGMGGASALGMEEDELEEKIKEVALNLKIQADQESVVRQKVMSLIEQGHKNRVPRAKTTEFLTKKNVPMQLINECFGEFEESLSFDGSDEDEDDYSEGTMTPSVSLLSPRMSELKQQTLSPKATYSL